MLSVSDEIFSLMLDDAGNGLHPALPLSSVHNAIAGALLMDLSLHERIDTDLKRLFVVDSTPLGEPILDQILALIADQGSTKPTSFWLDVLAVDGESLRTQMTNRLRARDEGTDGKHGQSRAKSPRHAPAVAGKSPQEVRQRIARVVLSDELPDPRDVMVVSLATACSLWGVLVHEALYRRHAVKIEQLAKMDLIGREVIRIIRTERS